jgi:hypothetical protein
MTLPDALGIFGSLLIVFAYFANLRGVLATTGPAYSLLNLIGASLILFSLWSAWNVAAIVMEGFWAVISIYGLVRVLIARGQARPR